MFPHRPFTLVPRAWLLAGTLALVLPTSLSASILGESIIDDRTYFALIAETGFGFHVNGSIFYDTSGNYNYPNLIQDALYTPSNDYQQAGPRNSYPWAMAWFKDALYVGTNRNIHCTIGDYTMEDEHCPAGTGSTSSIPDAWWNAEIWRYTPSGSPDPGGGPWLDEDYGLSGTWQRLYRSQTVQNTWGLGPLALALISSSIPVTTPSDVGYRMLKACDAGGTERLYAATYGLFGRVLYLNDAGTNFVPTTATPETTVNISRLLTWLSQPSTFDLGFRALTCFKGNLWTSPTGTLEDPDISYHPKIYRNPNPAGGAAWIEVANLKTANFDPNIEGIFQMEAMGNYLFVSAINRTTGWQLWRGTFTDTCTAASCPVTWEKVIDRGAGRPGDSYVPDPTDPTKKKIRISNAVATLGVFKYAEDEGGNGKYDLYIGVGESGYSEEGLTAAELLRIRDVQDGNKQWELVAGWPRQDWADYQANPGLINMTCQDANQGDLDADEKPINLSGYALPPGLLDDPEDTDKDDCFPASRPTSGSGYRGYGYGPGMGTDYYGNPAYYSFGIENYYWRMAEHEHTFYIGTLGRASLWRVDYDPLDAAANAPIIQRVFTGGLNDPNNQGVRALVSTPLGLALGFTNPNFYAVDDTGKRTGGLEIYIASDLFPTDASGQTGLPPVARVAVDTSSGVYDANGDGIYNFFDKAGKGSVNITLMDNGSYSPFGGAKINVYEWYEGDVSTNCATLDPSSITGTGTKVSLTTVVDATIAEKTYTLRVGAPTGTGGSMLYSCDTIRVIATANLPPTGGISANVPITSPYGLYQGIYFLGQLNLVDFDGDGSETYTLTGTCDGGQDPLTSCEWMEWAVANTFNPEACTLTNGQTSCKLVSSVTSPLDAPAYGKYINLVMEDDKGFSATYDVLINIQQVGSTPVCRNVDLRTQQGVPLSLNPADPLNDGNPICKDGDGNPMTYSVLTPPQYYGPSKGAVTVDNLTTITYTPNSGFTGVDQFLFRATDGLYTSPDTGIRVTVLPRCESGATTIPPTTYLSGNSYQVAFTDSISTQGAVVVGVGADVTFEAPQLHLQPGFVVQAGGLFRGISAGACQ